jgi:hypothetical protein
LLEFFQIENIREAFRNSFLKGDPSILKNEAEAVLQWHQIGAVFRKHDFDPRTEFATFSLIFKTPLKTLLGPCPENSG